MIPEMPQVSLPIDSAKVPALIKQINSHLAVLEDHVKAARAIRGAVQAFCEHKNKQYDNDPRGSSGYCQDCGKYF